MPKAHPVEGFVSESFLSRCVRSENSRQEAHILEDSFSWDQAKVLKNDPNGPAKERDLSRWNRGDIAAVYDDLTFRGNLLAEDQFEKRGFSGSAGTGKENELTSGNLEGKFPQGMLTSRIPLSYIEELDQGFECSNWEWQENRNLESKTVQLRLGCLAGSSEVLERSSSEKRHPWASALARRAGIDTITTWSLERSMAGPVYPREVLYQASGRLQSSP